MTFHNPIIPSQTSSHAPLEPTSGITLLHAELNRRANLAPPCATGCRELDDATLLDGGFERGCVVGISAEEDDVALVLGLQTVARLLLLDGRSSSSSSSRRRSREGKKPRVMVVTTMGVGSLVGVLREVLRAQGGGGGDGWREREREMLGRVAVSRVFDVNGLWEVLGEVDALGSSQEVGEGLKTPEMGQDQDNERGDEGDESLPDEGEAGLKSVPLPAFTAVPVLDEDVSQQVNEMSSSPLSDPPSSLPDIAPWDALEPPGLNSVGDSMGELHTDETATGDEDWSRKTPPGKREEIQDSEAEEGFSSPLAPAHSSPDRSSVKLPVPPSEKIASPTSLPIEPSHDQSDRESIKSPNKSAKAANLGEADMPSRPAIPENAQDDKAESQPKAKTPVPVDIETHCKEPSSCKDESNHPDIILITHMSTLLSSLFHQREKATAHQTLQLLASHLRYLTRSTEHGGPLIMILNSTTSSENSVAAPGQDDGPPRPQPPGGPPNTNRPLDPTLRSIFNPPPLPVSGLPYSYDTPHSRRNKPSFGLIFTQLLDLHLLCTKIPRTRADAEALYAPTSPGQGKVVEYVWAAEVLLDELGVWEGRENVLEGHPRRFRDQRWGAVEVRKDATGVRIADAFDKTTQSVPKQIVLAAGFGGPRV